MMRCAAVVASACALAAPAVAGEVQVLGGTSTGKSNVLLGFNSTTGEVDFSATVYFGEAIPDSMKGDRVEMFEAGNAVGSSLDTTHNIWYRTVQFIGLDVSANKTVTPGPSLVGVDVNTGNITSSTLLTSMGYGPLLDATSLHVHADPTDGSVYVIGQKHLNETAWTYHAVHVDPATGSQTELPSLPGFANEDSSAPQAWLLAGSSAFDHTTKTLYIQNATVEAGGYDPSSTHLLAWNLVEGKTIASKLNLNLYQEYAWDGVRNELVGLGQCQPGYSSPSCDGATWNYTVSTWDFQHASSPAPGFRLNGTGAGQPKVWSRGSISPEGNTWAVNTGAGVLAMQVCHMGSHPHSTTSPDTANTLPPTRATWSFGGTFVAGTRIPGSYPVSQLGRELLQSGSVGGGPCPTALEAVLIDYVHQEVTPLPVPAIMMAMAVRDL